jgi:hypothetical protein
VGIRDRGSISIADLLLRSKTLTKLELSSNEIGDEGTSVLCEPLYFQNKHLKWIDLANNYITDRSKEQLGALFKSNTTLRTLNLRNNRMKESAGRYLAESISCNHTLLHVNVELNDMDYADVVKIGERLKQNQKIYQDGAASRFRNTISELELSKEKLQLTESRITEVTQNLRKFQEQAKLKAEELETITLESEREVERMKANIEGIRQKTSQTSQRLLELISENSAIRSTRELNLRTMIGKINTEQDKCRRLEKKHREHKLKADPIYEEHAKIMHSLKLELEFELGQKREVEARVIKYTKLIQRSEKKAGDSKNKHPWRIASPISLSVPQPLSLWRKKESPEKLKQKQLPEKIASPNQAGKPPNLAKFNRTAPSKKREPPTKVTELSRATVINLP